VRCIVSNLLDDSSDILSEELTRGTTDHDILDEDNIGNDWQTWLPDPVDADTGTRGFFFKQGLALQVMRGHH